MAEDTKSADDISWAELKQPLIRMTLELGPLIVFFAVNTMGGRWLEASPLLSSWFSQPIIFATAVFMVAMAISLLLSWVLLKRVAVMPLVTGIVVLIFGTLTLVFQDATFIKMKPTIVNVIFGGALLVGLAFGKSLLAYVFDAAFQLRHPRCDPDGGLSAAGLDQCPAMDPGSDRAVDDIRNGRPGQNDQRQQEAEKKRPDRPIRTPCSSHF